MKTSDKYKIFARIFRQPDIKLNIIIMCLIIIAYIILTNLTKVNKFYHGLILIVI